MTLFQHIRRDERGAAAIILAICVVLLFGIAALVVDLGNTQDRKQASQNQADFAALAAVGGMSATTSGTPAASDGAVVLAAQYLIQNQPQTDATTGYPWGTSAATLANYLVDKNPGNGEVCYGTFDTSGNCVAQAGLFTVLTPPAQVNFDFAAAMNSNWHMTNVQSMATVGAGTPGAGTGMMPYYSISGCDYGLQTIAEPTNGQAAPPGINLAFPNDASSSAPTISDVSVTPAWSATSGLAHNQIPAPSQVPGVYPYAPPYSITITFSSGQASNVAQVGFFQSATTNPPAPITVGPAPASPNGFTVGTVNGTQSVTLQVPQAVYNPVSPYTTGTWYIRIAVTQGSKTTWSAIVSGNGNNGGNLVAYPFFVGDITMQCEQGSSAGNFGAIALTNALNTGGGPNGDLAQNIAYGLCGTLATGTCTGILGPYPPVVPSTCTPDGVTAIGWPSVSPPTNCVGTKTGYSATSVAMTGGLLTGQYTVDPTSNSPGIGRLVQRATPTPGFGEPTSSDCYGSQPPYVTGPLGLQQINNDTLSCFITDNTTMISQFASATYSLTGPVLSPDIYCSPRFFWVPVFPAQPANGTSQNYPIESFRPAFITNQALTAIHTTGPIDPNNGLNPGSRNGGKLQSVNIIFFNAAALPATSTGTANCSPQMGTWLGGDTPKVPLLKN